MQPYKRRGRFYNDKHDSILRRLKNFTRSFFYVTGHHILNLFRKRHLDKPVSFSHGCVDCPAQPVSCITWLGHSTFLIQVAGLSIITDPIFFGGFPIFSRKIPLPLAPDKLPRIDVVLISHNHKDHLDLQSLRMLGKHDPLLLVPAGNGPWLARRGYKHVVEKTWWEAEVVTPRVSITFLPAVHWASRGLLDINTTLWGSWLIEAAGHKIYFAGDTASGEHFSMIAQRHGPIDVALMPIGPNEPRQFIFDSHINADEAVKAFVDLQARHFIPMHWGTFGRMGVERYDNPMILLKQAWEDRAHSLVGKNLHIVACGEATKLC